MFVGVPRLTHSMIFHFFWKATKFIYLHSKHISHGMSTFHPILQHFAPSRKSFPLLDQWKTEIRRIRWSNVFSFISCDANSRKRTRLYFSMLLFYLALIFSLSSLACICNSTSHQRVTTFKKAFLVRNMHN